jgi:hypothetical protein
MTRMTAKQLIDLAAACTVCGMEHKPRKFGIVASSYAGLDGHSYRPRINQLTNASAAAVVKTLRELAGEPHD